MGTLTDLDRGSVLAQLRSRIDRMQESGSREALPTHPALAGLVRLKAGASYEVDNATLALALLAGPTGSGGWAAVLGEPDFGAEAATQLGVDLSRTVLVPDPGEHWVEATAALIPITSVVLLRPPAAVRRSGISPGAASRLAARLRKHGTVLVVRGDWPGSEARLGLQESVWSGIGPGGGRLRERRLTVVVRRLGAPPTHAEWLLRDDDGVSLTGRQEPELDGHRNSLQVPVYPADRVSRRPGPLQERAG